MLGPVIAVKSWCYTSGENGNAGCGGRINFHLIALVYEGVRTGENLRQRD